MMRLRPLTAVVCIPTAVAAIGVADARARKPAAEIPVRALAVSTVSRETFGAIVGIRQLPGGRLLVNDGKRRRVFLLDSALKLDDVVFDSTTGAGNSYGTRAVPVIPYVGDSSIFVDMTSRTMVLITPQGKIGRVISAPNDPGIWTASITAVGVDDKGRIIYSGLELVHGARKNGPLSINMAGNGAAPVTNADSLPVIRADLAKRRVDTIAGLLNFGAKKIETSQLKDRTLMTTYVNPVANGDAWGLMSDGTIAIVRGHDYHVDWLTSDNKMTSSPKMAFDWKRLTDEDKTRLRDSAITAMAKADSVMEAMRSGASEPGAAGGGGGAMVARGGGRGGGEGGPPPGPPPIRKTEMVPIAQMPDYVPPIRAGSARGDSDNNLWILPTTSAQSLKGELVYDVVNRKGELYQRVRAPLGRSIAGFGPNGVVYLLSGDIKTGFQLERAKVTDAATSSN